MNFDWKKTLATVAPALATALGSPMAGVAVRALATQFLDKDDASEEDIALAVQNASPADLVRIKEIDANFKRDMEKLEVDLERIAASDRKDARRLAVNIGIVPQLVLAAIYTLGYVFVLYAFATGSVVIAEDSRAEFSIILGVLTAAQAQILNFWYGSSSGSKEKTSKLIWG